MGIDQVVDNITGPEGTKVVLSLDRPIVAAADAQRTTDALTAIGESPIALGEVVKVPEGTDFEARVVFT